MIPGLPMGLMGGEPTAPQGGEIRIVTPNITFEVEIPEGFDTFSIAMVDAGTEPTSSWGGSGGTLRWKNDIPVPTDRKLTLKAGGPAFGDRASTAIWDGGDMSGAETSPGGNGGDYSQACGGGGGGGAGLFDAPGGEGESRYIGYSGAGYSFTGTAIFSGSCSPPTSPSYFALFTTSQQGTPNQLISELPSASSQGWTPDDNGKLVALQLPASTGGCYYYYYTITGIGCSSLGPSGNGGFAGVNGGGVSLGINPDFSRGRGIRYGGTLASSGGIRVIWGEGRTFPNSLDGNDSSTIETY